MPTMLILEDDDLRGRALVRKYREVGYDITVVKSYQDAVAALSEWPQFDVASLDHDLGTKATGNDVAKFIGQLPAEKCPREVLVHSANPVGAENIMATLRDAGIKPRRTPLF